MATTNDLKNGMVLNLDGQLWSVTWFQHHKPGKGGAVVRTKLKNIESGKTVDKTFNADVKVEVANVDKRTMQYLYNDGTSYVFMDSSTFDQLEVSPEIVGAAKNFLLENQDAIVATNEGRVLYVELPASVELTVEYTDPGLQGDRSTGGTKPARLETGHEINVPLFITTGEKIKVDTRDSSYLGRVTQLSAPDARSLQGRQAGARRALRVRGPRASTWPDARPAGDRSRATGPPVHRPTDPRHRRASVPHRRGGRRVRPRLVAGTHADRGPQCPADRCLRDPVRRRGAGRGRGQRSDEPGAGPLHRRVVGVRQRRARQHRPEQTGAVRLKGRRCDPVRELR